MRPAIPAAKPETCGGSDGDPGDDSCDTASYPDDPGSDVCSMDSSIGFGTGGDFGGGGSDKMPEMAAIAS